MTGRYWIKDKRFFHEELMLFCLHPEPQHILIQLLSFLSQSLHWQEVEEKRCQSTWRLDRWHFAQQLPLQEGAVRSHHRATDRRGGDGEHYFVLLYTVNIYLIKLLLPILSSILLTRYALYKELLKHVVSAHHCASVLPFAYFPSSWKKKKAVQPLKQTGAAVTVLQKRKMNVVWM